MYQKDELLSQVKEEIDFEKLQELCEHLKDAICEIFQSCGLYFRIFSRVKSAESITEKIIRGQYGSDANPKKLQDLIGLRVVLYYYDDLSICRDIMESTFRMIDTWSKTNYNADEFKAAKINGVFKFPSEYFKSYTRELWSLPIDITFEIQFRTVFFEGWHEIEHDMRYKSLLSDEQFWQGSEELSRILNCILANLELSDWSLVQLFEQLSYNHYKNGNWELMLKSKFRIKMDNTESLDKRILTLFDQNRELAKQFFKCSRHDLIRELLKLDNPRVTHNLIVRVLNERTVHNRQITDICETLPLYSTEHAFQKAPLQRLDTGILFQLAVPLLHKSTRLLSSEFNNAASILYKWVRFKFNAVFPDMPSELCTYRNSIPGYDAKLQYEPENLCFNMKLQYIDAQSTGTIHQMNTSIHLSEEGSLYFRHITMCHTPHGFTQKETFRKPSFLTDLSNKVGLLDGIRLTTKAHFVKSEEDYQFLLDFLREPVHKLPVILIAQRQNSEIVSEQEYRDGYDMNTFSMNGTRLAKVTGLYSHVFMLDRKWLESWAAWQQLSVTDADGCIMIYWPVSSGKKQELYTEKMIFDTQFDFNRFAFHDQNINEKAFRHKLVQIIKDSNIQSGSD